MRLVRFFFAASWKTIFTSLVEQELSENNLLSTIARLDKEWRVTVEVNPEFQYPISRILNQACSTSKNLLSYIFFASYWAESSNSPPGAWARDRQLPHRWDSFIFQQCCMFSELTMTLRRLARCRRLWSTAANTEVCGHWTSQLLQSPKGHLNVSPIPVFPSFASSSVHFIISGGGSYLGLWAAYLFHVSRWP